MSAPTLLMALNAHLALAESGNPIVSPAETTEFLCGTWNQTKGLYFNAGSLDQRIVASLLYHPGIRQKYLSAADGRSFQNMLSMAHNNMFAAMQPIPGNARLMLYIQEGQTVF